MVYDLAMDTLKARMATQEEWEALAVHPELFLHGDMV